MLAISEALHSNDFAETQSVAIFEVMSGSHEQLDEGSRLWSGFVLWLHLLNHDRLNLFSVLVDHGVAWTQVYQDSREKSILISDYHLDALTS